MYKILDRSKLKSFADNKINVDENLKFVLKRVQKIFGERRKYWIPAFSPSPTFSKGYFFKVIKNWDVW